MDITLSIFWHNSTIFSSPLSLTPNCRLTFVAYSIASPGFPSLPHLPTSYQYTTGDAGKPQWTTYLTSLIYTPIPNAMVDIKERQLLLGSPKWLVTNASISFDAPEWYCRTKAWLAALSGVAHPLWLDSSSNLHMSHWRIMPVRWTPEKNLPQRCNSK